MADWAISHSRNFRLVGAVFAGGTHPELVVCHGLAGYSTDGDLGFAKIENGRLLVLKYKPNQSGKSPHNKEQANPSPIVIHTEHFSLY